MRCPRQRRHHERYSEPSAALLSAFKRNCRELRSIECLNSPEIGGVCEMSGIEREGPPSFRKAPHIYTRYKSYNNNRPGSVSTPCCKLKTASVFISSLARYTYVAVFSFAIRRSFACGEGAPAATAAAAAAAAAVLCSFSLIISVLSVAVIVCLLCYLFCVTLALLVAAILYSCDS